MPIYMDRHDVSETVTAANVAELHQADLKIQHQFDCRGLTYWFDDVRKTAFCLIEAPNAQAIKDMHDHAHGEVPHQVIEVDASIVESFLGRIEDPQNAQKTELNIINDPAFRLIMVISYSSAIDQLSRIFSKAEQIIKNENGRVVQKQTNQLLVSFKSVTSAINCAHTLHDNVKNSIETSISAGVPVNGTDSFFEDAILQAEQMNQLVAQSIVVSSTVSQLYESEHRNNKIPFDDFRVLSPKEEQFLQKLSAFTANNWTNPELKVEDFEGELGYSKSQLYRTIKSLTNHSPNSFIKNYRLHQALIMLNGNIENISEISYKCGFGSPSYFTKCFNAKYNYAPSEHRLLT